MKKQIKIHVHRWFLFLTLGAWTLVRLLKSKEFQQAFNDLKEEKKTFATLRAFAMEALESIKHTVKPTGTNSLFWEIKSEDPFIHIYAVTARKGRRLIVSIELLKKKPVST